MAIVQRTHYAGCNPWKFFSKPLGDAPLLAPPRERAPAAPPADAVSISQADAVAAAAAIRVRWERSRTPGYAVAGIKSLTVAKVTGSWKARAEDGTAWGEALHAILEELMRRPDTDLSAFAANVVTAQELDQSRLEDAVRLAGLVSQSDIWRRAKASPRRFVELPLSGLDPREAQAALPTLLHGYVDLVFQEANGWVIVDYKSDLAPPGTLQSLVRHYRGQVDLYAALWESLTGELVAERGLYFLSANEYVKW